MVHSEWINMKMKLGLQKWNSRFISLASIVSETESLGHSKVDAGDISKQSERIELWTK